MSLLPLDDPAWGPWPWPAKVTALYPAQETAINEIVSHFERGIRVVALDAPTGSGKTVVAEAVRRRLQSRALYVCIDRGLQDQFASDFTFAALLKGRRNYPTLNRPEVFGVEPFLTCEDCDLDVGVCSYCDEPDICPYRAAKRRALGADLACVNTAYFLREANSAGGLSSWPLVVADEADRLEGALMLSVEVEFNRRRLTLWGLEHPRNDIAMWLQGVLPLALADAQYRASLLPSDDVQVRRDARRAKEFLARVSLLVEEYQRGGWVCCDVKGGGVAFRPVMVNTVGPSALWAHSARWLLMSATLLGTARLLRALGWAERFAVVQMPSTFPVARRPLYVWPVADNVKAKQAESLPKLVGAIEQILQRHPQERILIHTVSFRLLEELREHLVSSRLHFYESMRALPRTLAAYLSQLDGVLVAPALERGLDLPDGACRVIVVSKVPYPDLGDAQVAARMALPGGREWYLDQALRALVQMTGRGMRHAEDRCVSYLLDAQVRRLLRQHGDRLPRWWREAIVTIRGLEKVPHGTR